MKMLGLLGVAIAASAFVPVVAVQAQTEVHARTVTTEGTTTRERDDHVRRVCHVTRYHGHKVRRCRVVRR